MWVRACERSPGRNGGGLFSHASTGMFSACRLPRSSSAWRRRLPCVPHLGQPTATTNSGGCGSMSADLPIILLSGMAADERLFEPQLEEFPTLRVPAWIDPCLRSRCELILLGLLRSCDPGCPVSSAVRRLAAWSRWRWPHSFRLRHACLSAASGPRTSYPGAGGHFGPRPFSANRVRSRCWAHRSAPGPLADTRNGPAVTAVVTPPRPRSFAGPCVPSFTGVPARPPAECGCSRSTARRIATLPIHGTRPDWVVPGGGHALPLTSPGEVNRFIRQSQIIAASWTSRCPGACAAPLPGSSAIPPGTAFQTLFLGTIPPDVSPATIPPDVSRGESSRRSSGARP